LENKAHALIAGLFTLTMLVIAVVIGLWFTRDKVARLPYEMVTQLSIPGLNPQAAVRYRGLDVGIVDGIFFDPKVAGQILVHMNIKVGTPITQSTYGVLSYQGVTGIAYVELDDDGSKPAPLVSSKEHTARIEMRPSLLDQLQKRGLAILLQTDQIAIRLNELLAPGNQKSIITAFDNVGRAALALEGIPAQIKPTLDRLPGLVKETELTLASVAKLSNSVARLGESMQAKDGVLGKLSDAADQVGATANRIELETQPMTKDIRASVRTVNRAAESVMERPQGFIFGSPAVAPGPGEAGFGENPKK
jgi:phospholipid/cholesterol/gamma-HCH transport system substrate-binding protein